MSNSYQAIIDLGSYDSDLEPLVGKRALSRSYLLWHHLPAPSGFVLTPIAFSKFLSHDNGISKWKKILATGNRLEPSSLIEISKSLQRLILSTSFPEDLSQQIVDKYHSIIGAHARAHITISPSSTTKVPVTPLVPIIKGETSLLELLKEVWAAQITPHHLSLLLEQDSTIIPQMTPLLVSEYEPALISGTINSIDIETLNKHVISIEAIFGTSPAHDPLVSKRDVYLVDKMSKQIISRNIQYQDKQIVADRFGHEKRVALPAKFHHQRKLENDQLIALASYTRTLEQQLAKPIILNYLITNKGMFFTRFDDLISKNSANSIIKKNEPNSHQKIIARGLPVNLGIATGPIKRLTATTSIVHGHIVVLKTINTNLLKQLSNAAGIIIEEGGMNSLLATLAHEIGIPMLVGCGPIALRDGHVVTLDTTNQLVYQNLESPVSRAAKDENYLPNKQSAEDTSPHTTPIYITTTAITVSESLPRSCAGVAPFYGSLILSESGIHPRYLIDHNRNLIFTLLKTRLEQVCTAAGDRPVWYYPFAVSTAECYVLEHGRAYEPIEPNPILGIAGANRLSYDLHIFDLELEVITYLRQKSRITNLSLMIPHVRSIKEFNLVKKHILSSNLSRSKSFRIGAEISTPSSSYLIKPLLDQGLDMISIDLDRLSALVCGYDPYNKELDQEIEINHPAVLDIVKTIINSIDTKEVGIIITSNKIDQSYDLLDSILRLGSVSVSVSHARFAEIEKSVRSIEINIAKAY